MIADPRPVPALPTLFDLRRGAHRFLSQHADMLWCSAAAHGHGRVRMPPAVETLPDPECYRTHAQQETQRLADASMYDMSPWTTAWAVQQGAIIRAGDLGEIVTPYFGGVIVETTGFRPPSKTGILRWQDRHGVGYTAQGAPLLACHWGPVNIAGLWLVVWADNHVMARSHLHADPPWADLTCDPLRFGPLWYARQHLLIYRDLNDHHDEQSRESRDLPRRPRGLAGGQADPLICTILASLTLLTDPPTKVNLTEQPPTIEERAADQAAGLHPRPVIVAEGID